MQRNWKKKKNKPQILFRKTKKCNNVCVCWLPKDVILVYAELLVCYRKWFYNVPCYVDLKCNLGTVNFLQSCFIIKPM